MDWSRAKTYLIIAFIVTNLLLIWSIFSDIIDTQQQNFFSKQSIANLKSLLDQKKIRLDCKLPKTKKKMRILYAEYQTIDEQKYQKIFQSEPSMQINLISGKQLTVKNKQLLRPYDTVQACHAAEAFITKYRLGDEHMLRYTLTDQESIQVIYEPDYRKNFSEGHYLKLSFFKSGGFVLEMIRLKISKDTPFQELTTTSVEAVMQASTEMEPGEVIKAIDLGYQYEEHQTNFEQAQFFTAFPSWRIHTDKDKVYHIQALD